VGSEARGVLDSGRIFYDERVPISPENNLALAHHGVNERGLKAETLDDDRRVDVHGA
jgi:hypothetical protein